MSLPLSYWPGHKKYLVFESIVVRDSLVTFKRRHFLLQN